MLNWIATDTNEIQWIINLLNKCPMYTTYKYGDNQTLRNDDNFKSDLKAAIKDNRYIIWIKLNIKNIHFKPLFKPKIFEEISKNPFPTSRCGNRNPGTGPVIHPTSINIPHNLVTSIEDISEAIQKYIINQPSTGIIGEVTTPMAIFNHAKFPNDVKDIYLYKGNLQKIMTGDTMKIFNTGIPVPSYPAGKTMITLEYHMDPPITGYRLFTRDWTSFQMIKQDTAIDKKNYTPCLIDMVHLLLL